MKKFISILLMCIVLSALSACGNESVSDTKDEATANSISEEKETAEPELKQEESTTPSKAEPESTLTPAPKNKLFTNAYGTETTKCTHSGCNNYIASSGNTNCCTTHSKKCLECGKYIDEDASYCMTCLEKAFKGKVLIKQ